MNAVLMNSVLMCLSDFSRATNDLNFYKSYCLLLYELACKSGSNLPSSSVFYSCLSLVRHFAVLISNNTASLQSSLSSAVSGGLKQPLVHNLSREKSAQVEHYSTTKSTSIQVYGIVQIV
jgi:hypothetical protein